MRHSKWLFAIRSFPLLVRPRARSRSQPRTFKARLSPVPIDVSMQATIAGSRLGVRRADRHEAGDHRHVRRSEVASDHRADPQGAGPRRARPDVLDLDRHEDRRRRAARSAARSTSPPIQVADLEKGRLYVQLHSEKAPDGNLWGWLLPQENKR